ncbi:hypothetical protein [Lentibacillus sp. Marseille-P4043]|nr:hypothetical protein [Lentibacillus sp. Marseille-P4043]
MWQEYRPARAETSTRFRNYRRVRRNISPFSQLSARRLNHQPVFSIIGA